MKLGFALIGCGRIAQNHVNALAAIPDADLLAVCDLDISKAKKLVEGTDVPYFSNYHEMIKKVKPDVVNIITPSGMHATHVIDIIQTYGKHVVVEKPMALRVEDCERMIECAERHKVQLHVVLQNRFNRAVRKLREGIENGLFGKLVLGTVRLRWCRPQRYYDQAPWRGTWGFDGGALTNQAIHHIDLLQWMFGEVTEVSAVAATQLVRVEVEDTAAAWLRFKNGALGIIEATTAARPDDLEASLSILGEKGTAIVEGSSVNRLTTWSFSQQDLNELSEDPPNVYGFGHLPFLESVIHSILNGEAPLIGGKEAIKSVALLHAIYRSIETGGTVRPIDRPRSGKFGIIDPDLQNIYKQYLTPSP